MHWISHIGNGGYIYPYPGVFMTAIIGFVRDNKTYIAGERANSDMSSILPSLSSKVFNIGPYAYGYAGITGIGQFIGKTFPFTPPEKGIDIYDHIVINLTPALRLHVKDAGIDIDKEDSTDILLGYRGRLFELSTTDYQCVEYNASAIGSGRDFCLGAYYVLEENEHPIYIAKTCIEAAIKYSPTCQGTVDVIFS